MPKIFLLVTFALTLIFVSTSIVHGNAVIPDIGEHWVHSAIQKMVDERIIAGYPNGTFRPFTSAEFISLIGDGDAIILNNVTVEGTTFIRGGGKNSIYINGGRYNNMVVENAPGGNIRLVAANTEGLQIIIAEEAAGAEIMLEGVFAGVAIRADGIVLSIRSAAVIETVINEIFVPENIAGTVINIEKNSTVKKLVLDSVATVNNAEDTVENISGKKAGDSIILNLPKRYVSLNGRVANDRPASTVKKEPEIVLEGIADMSAVGLYDNFVMSVNPGDYGNRNVITKIQVVSGDVNGFQLEYFLDEEGLNRERRWITADFDGEGACRFTPGSGCSLTGKTLDSVDPVDFRVTWNAEGTYEFEASVIAETAEGIFENELAAAGFTVQVIGGLIGFNDAGSQINNSYSRCNLEGIGSSSGGLAGKNDGLITNSYATGNVTGKSAGGLVWENNGNVYNCYAAGFVSATSKEEGGLAGSKSSSGTTYSSYWDKDTTGQSISPGGGTPLTTAAMKRRDSFKGWDFTGAWRIIDGETYPYLWWQPGTGIF